MDKVILVFLGGGIGSVLRFLLQHWLNADPSRWAWGTLIANILGSAAAGALAGLASTRLALDEHARLLLATGILGGFTTLSAMAGETVTIGVASPGRAAAYVGATNLASIAAAAGMYAIVRTLSPLRST